jgi:hypothetical protein
MLVNYQRLNGGMTLASYSMAQSSDITSPYDLSNHPSPANSSHNMHSPSYQSSVINDCKFSDDDRNTTIKLEPHDRSFLLFQGQHLLDN